MIVGDDGVDEYVFDGLSDVPGLVNDFEVVQSQLIPKGKLVVPMFLIGNIIVLPDATPEYCKTKGSSWEIFKIYAPLSAAVGGRLV